MQCINKLCKILLKSVNNAIIVFSIAIYIMVINHIGLETIICFFISHL